MLKRIGAEESGEFKAVASGTLPSGKPVVVNSNGTVSVISDTSTSQATGSAVVYENDNSFYNAAVYDPNAQKVVVGYADGGDSNKGKAVVGTISGTSISFGTPVLFEEGAPFYLQGVYDENAQKIVFLYRDLGNSNYGTAIVGTVSGTSISFGTAAIYNTGRSDFISAAYDSSNGKVVVAYKDSGNSNQGTAVVGTVSGTSISFGSEVIFAASGSVSYTSTVYDTNAQKIVTCYEFIDSGGSNQGGRASVGTVSGSSISFGTAVEFESSPVEYIKAVYDENAQKVAIFYQDEGNSDYGTAIVGTVSGTSISFGSAAVFDNTEVKFITAAYHADAKNITLSYQDNTNTQRELVVATISGTSISFGSVVVLDTDTTDQADSVYDSDNKVVLTVYRDYGNSNYGTAIIFQTGYTSTNLTSENYIGMSRGVVDVAGSATQALGSAVVFEAASSTNIGSAFDSNLNKVVIVYKDIGNSNYGTAVVGTVSGTSISFGTPVVFDAQECRFPQPAFDSSNNKIVIAYRDFGATIEARAIVGTVSGTSISFGSSVAFTSAGDFFDIFRTVFDSNSNKIVILYRDGTNSDSGAGIVGTVSGTSISFGTKATFNQGNTTNADAVFDSTLNKIVVVYKDNANSDYGAAVVGTVSGTSISFGSEVIYENAATNYNSVAYDTNSQKVVVAYQDDANSDYGTAIVGTVSGTSISFGSPVVFENAAVSYVRAVYDPTAKKVVIAYMDQGNSDYGTVISGTVSGTSISFDSATVFENAQTAYIELVNDSNAEKIVIAYRDYGNSSHGTSIVFQTGYEDITRAEIADGGNASMDIIGSVSDNQIGLTAGQQYFVQTDGTIDETADSPSVLAGTAISATELLVKT